MVDDEGQLGFAKECLWLPFPSPGRWHLGKHKNINIKTHVIHSYKTKDQSKVCNSLFFLTYGEDYEDFCYTTTSNGKEGGFCDIETKLNSQVQSLENLIFRQISDLVNLGTNLRIKVFILN